MYTAIYFRNSRLSRAATALVVLCLLATANWACAQPASPPNDVSDRESMANEPISVPETAALQRIPELGKLPQDQVLLTICEGMTDTIRWPEDASEAFPVTAMWTSDAFLLPRIPQRYDDWGIRDQWRSPVLLRMAADVQLAPGSYRVLLRARSLGRLWINGKVVAQTTPFNIKSPDGEQPVTPVPKPPLLGMRPAGYHQQEVFGQFQATGLSPEGRYRVILELMVGGPKLRTDTGEVVVALQHEREDCFQVLTPLTGSRFDLTDKQVAPALARIGRSLDLLDDITRREAARGQDAYWATRHQQAAKWAEQHPAPVVPITPGTKAKHPIDAFIDEKTQLAVTAAQHADPAESAYFESSVLPILRDQCFRCHGDKAQGDLKLNRREDALLAGESGQPAVVPGHPDASELIVQVRAGAMPPTESGLTESQIATLVDWVQRGAPWPAQPVNPAAVSMPGVIGDEGFMRRAYLDTLGVLPTVDEASEFLHDERADKRELLVQRLLNDDRTADHWMSQWQDMLAENPTLINASMGSTGPFRWFLHEALRDRKALDRIVTELIMMKGDSAAGGSAGFGLSGESDSPMAAKAHVIASAFLGVELQCAKCHDSPYHATKQSDLYSLAAMLERSPLKVPQTSRVPDAFFAKKGRESLIRVTLDPNQELTPQWPLREVIGVHDDQSIDELMRDPSDHRERLAALITAPQNHRFAEVMVNRVWKQLIGTGLVEPIDDWEGKSASHPKLLPWLAQRLVSSAYDIRVVIRDIMTSQLYQREAVGQNQIAGPEQRYFVAPDRRRMTAEQVVDSLHAAMGRKMDCETLTFVHDGARTLAQRQDLGRPHRAWMLANLNNERDRPSLSLPKAQAIVDLMSAFGWDGARQSPVHRRPDDANVLQPGIMSNGPLAMSLVRVTPDSDLARLAKNASSPEAIVDELFLRVLTRRPTTEQRQRFSQALAAGFHQRLLPPSEIVPLEPVEELPLVTWFNHLQSETNVIQQQREQRVARGPQPDPTLNPQWRQVYEDVVWSLINAREFVWIP